MARLTSVFFQIATLSLSLSACFEASVPGTSGASTGLRLLVSDTTVSPGGSVQFSASGGTQPYTYTLMSGTGQLSSTTGLFVAPATGETVQVQVADSRNLTSSLSISVDGSAFSLNVSAMSISPGQVVALSASGGSAPYTYAMSGGGGSISGSTYTAPNAVDTESIAVTDSTGSTSTISFSILGSAEIGKFVSISTNTAATPVANLIDGKTNTCYTSGNYSNGTPSYGPHVIINLGDSRGAVGSYAVDHLNLTAHIVNGKTISAFPVSYDIQAWNASSNSWNDVGTFTTQPAFDGVARVTFSQVVTSQIAIVPTQLSKDTNGNWNFQLCEIGQ